MLKRRAARVVTAGVLVALPVFGLTACRTSPNVAAYVGEEQVTIAELERAVEERTSDEAIAEVAAGDEDGFTRRVLTVLVQQEVYTEAAKRYGVEVDADDVRAEIDQLLGGDDPEEVYASLAQQGIARADVFASVRQRLIGQRIAAEEGRADELEDAALEARYEQTKEEFAEYSFGYIAVPDEATAAAVLAQLAAAPSAYATIAAQYPGDFTLPALEARPPAELPQVLAQGITTTQPGSGFTTPVPETGGIVVTFVEGIVYPPFEEVRPQLEAQAADAVQQAAVALVSAVQQDLGVTVNPRFGRIDENRVVPATDGVVDILGDEAPAPEAGE